MEVRDVAYEAVRAVAVLSALALVGVLLYYLPQPGYSQSRLVLFVLISGGALLGAAGVVLRNIWLIAAGGTVLFLLGFWQAVLSVFIFPVIGLLTIAAFAEAARRNRHPTE